MGLCVAALCAPASASAATYTVDTTADPTSDNECAVDCTLREAVFVAGSADTINVPPGDYALQQGQLVLASDNIRGTNARTTIIRAAPSSRVIQVSGAETRASITGVTITGGAPVAASAQQQGGGILIDSGAILLLVDSAVGGNSANAAGGIMVNGALGMARSTVSGNTATSAAGGGIGVANGGTASLTNSTVSGNGAEATRLASGGGVYQATGQLPTAATLRDTIVSGNVGGDCAGDAATIAAWQGNHNLDRDGSCGFSAVGHESRLH